MYILPNLVPFKQNATFDYFLLSELPKTKLLFTTEYKIISITSDRFFKSPKKLIFLENFIIVNFISLYNYDLKKALFRLKLSKLNSPQKII